MPTNGAFRVEIYYSPYFKKYKVVPKQFRQGNLSPKWNSYRSTEENMQNTEVVLGELVNSVLYHPWYSNNDWHRHQVKYFKTLKKANKHADKVATMGTKFLEKSFPNKEDWQQVSITALPSNKRYRLSAEDVEELEKK